MPIEAMYMRCIVFACNSGGPRESIGEDFEWKKRGAYLLKPEGKVWAEKL